MNRYGTTLRIYDNGGKTCDRYTIIPPRWAKDYRETQPGTFLAIAASERPFHPQGFGQHTGAMPGPHLGKRIHWDALPADVQKFARQSFPEFAPLPYALDIIAGHFLAAAVWADREEGTNPQPTKQAHKTAREFCRAFIDENLALSLAAMRADGYGAHSFGHDLYLTAAGHGAGFWDRDALQDDDIGDKLTDILREQWRRWHIETEQYRGWFYLSAPNFTKEAQE